MVIDMCMDMCHKDAILAVPLHLCARVNMRLDMHVDHAYMHVRTHTQVKWSGERRVFVDADSRQVAYTTYIVMTYIFMAYSVGSLWMRIRAGWPTLFNTLSTMLLSILLSALANALLSILSSILSVKYDY